MRIHNYLRVFAVSLAGALVTVSLAGTSAAETAIKPLPIEEANPGISKAVVESLPDVVKNSSVKIADDFEPGTPIYFPNGELVPGQSVKAKAAAAACTESVYSAVTGTWGAVATSCHAIFGSPGLRVPYKWQATSSSSGVASRGTVRVRGFRNGTAYWASNGSNVGFETKVVTVDWGNVLASLQAQGYKISGSIFTARFWYV